MLKNITMTLLKLECNKTYLLLKIFKIYHYFILVLFVVRLFKQPEISQNINKNLNLLYKRSTFNRCFTLG